MNLYCYNNSLLLLNEAKTIIFQSVMNLEKLGGFRLPAGQLAYHPATLL